MTNILEYLKSSVPSELKRVTSPLSIFLALIIIGIFAKLGETIFDFLLTLIKLFVPKIAITIVPVLAYTIPVNINLITLLIFIILFLPLYRFFDKNLLNWFKGAVIFEDKFDFANKGWVLNYWHSINPDNTCRIEQSSMVFEAEDEDLISPQKENGAYFDLTNGIYQGSKYEASCWVKSGEGTTMGFKLWVHDTTGRAEMKSSAGFYTPGTQYEEIKVHFIGTKSRALRIHLHYKAGRGKIFVDRVKVVKV